MAWTDLKRPHAGQLFKIVFYLDPFPVLLRGWGHGLNIHKSTINKKAYVSVLITLTVRSFLTFLKHCTTRTESLIDLLSAQSIKMEIQMIFTKIISSFILFLE